MQFPQGRAGVGAQFLGQPVPGLFEVLKGVGLAATAVQSEHELTGEPLVQRVLPGARCQVGDQFGVPTLAQQQIGPVQFRGPALGMQGFAQPVRPGRVQVGQGVAVPEPQRLLEQGRGALVVPGCAGLSHEPAEVVQVHFVRRDAQNVAAGDAFDRRTAGQSVPQAGKVAVERVTGPVRWVVRPDPADQLIHGHQPVRVDQQRGQHTPLPGRPEIHRTGVHPRLDGAQQPENHRHHALPSAAPPRVRPADSSRTQDFTTVAVATSLGQASPLIVPPGGGHDQRGRVCDMIAVAWPSGSLKAASHSSTPSSCLKIMCGAPRNWTPFAVRSS